MTKPNNFSQADVTRAVKAAKAAGLKVTCVEITPDGTIRVLTGAGVSPALSEADRWFAEHGDD